MSTTLTRASFVRNWMQLITALILTPYFGLGMLRGQEGVVFLDLCLLLRVEIDHGSLLYMFSSLGYMLGSLGAGILSDHTHVRVIHAFSAFGAGALSFLVPFCETLPLMGFCALLRSVFAGGIATVSTLMCAKLWKGESNTALQMLNFSFAAGALVISLVSEPFLAKNHLHFAKEPLNGSNSNQTADHFSSHSPITNVYVSFIIVGLYIIVVSVPLQLVMSIKDAQGVLLDLNGEDTTRIVDATQESRSLSAKMISTDALIFLLYMAYGCIEKGFSTFLMAFVISFLGMCKRDAAYLTSLFWGTFAASRWFGILGSKLLSEFQMLSILFPLLFCGIFLLFFTSLGPMWPVWMACFFVGAGVAGIFPTVASWVNINVKPVTGFISAIFYVSGSLGSMVILPLLGCLLNRFSPLWFIYLNLASALVCFLAFVALCLMSQHNTRLI